MEHSGTTMLNAYMQTIPGLFGPFETGFLLAESPSTFSGIHPFYEWTLNSTNRPNRYWSFQLTSAQMDALLKVGTHAAMYKYVRVHSPLFAGSVRTQWLVDKTPGYVYELPSVMARAPDVPVLVIQRPFEELKHSWLHKHGASLALFEKKYERARESLRAALRLYPKLIHVIDYSLFKTREGAQRALKDACKFVGLEWKDEYITLENFWQYGPAWATRGQPTQALCCVGRAGIGSCHQLHRPRRLSAGPLSQRRQPRLQAS